MLDKDGKRMLAYVAEIVDVEPAYFCKTIIKEDGTKEFVPDLNDKGEKVYADSIDKAHVVGWSLIVNKGEFKPGDKCVFFEIDSKIPENKFLDENGEDVFEFLAKKKYCVRTYKLNKFGVWSMGLAIPLSKVGIPEDTELLTDLTETLGVTYAVKEDNERKANPRSVAVANFKARHKKFFSNKVVKKLMKYKFFRSLFLLPARLEKKKKSNLPWFLHPSDEERLQNMPWVLEDKTIKWHVSEKLDGTNTTVAVERKPLGKFEVYVCSRNRTLHEESEYYNGNENIYYEMCKKYHIDEFLINYLKKHKNLKWAYVKGESFGPKWQGNPLKATENDFRAFDFADNENGRYDSLTAATLLMHDGGIPWVPVYDYGFTLLDTVDDMLEYATGPSLYNPNVMREGFVFRAPDGKRSFKAVSPEYLLNKKD